MPSTILSSLLSKPSLSITGDTDNQNYAQSLGIKKASIKLRSKVFRHRREDGTSIVDARVCEPMVFEADVLVPSLDAMAILNACLIDRVQTFTVKSRGLVLKNMVANSESIKQDGEILSENVVRVEMKELLEQDNNNAAQTVQQPADASLLDQGLQQVQQAAISVQQFAQNIETQLGATVNEAVISGEKLVGL
jgi:hypothetical protein